MPRTYQVQRLPLFSGAGGLVERFSGTFSIWNNCSMIENLGLNHYQPQEMSAKMVSYVTDIEGNYDYWSRFIAISKVLCGAPGAVDFRDERGQLVFGGDICDRGSGDVRIIGDLLQLKEKYPERVHFVLGNRDTNKMRLYMELSSKCLQQELNVFFVKNKSFPIGTSDNDRVERLKWILLHSMGSPVAFESRREELIELGKPATDEHVLQSFLDYANPSSPEGPLVTYLKHGVIAKRYGDILFVHGAIHGYNIGWVPPYDGKESQVATNLDDWIHKINEFARHESQDYAERTYEYVGKFDTTTDLNWSHSGGYNHDQPGSRLLHYGVGVNADDTLNPSVIYAAYSTETNQPEPQVSEWLTSNGIRTLVVGHQPRGDAPMLLDNNGLQIVSGDTSYAKNALWDKDGTGTWASIASSKAESELNYPASSTRADVVSEVLIDIDETGNSVVSVHGVLSDGGKYEYILPKSSSNQYLGKSTSTGWIVKASNVRYSSDPESSYYLLSQVSGFDTKNRLVPHDNINLEFY